MKLAGWGRYPVHDCDITRPRSETDLRARLSKGKLIARGNGRAYGDSAMSPSNTVDMRAFNRMVAFDDVTGQLTVEAGVLLGDVISAFLPRGWFPAVTPGTKFVTIGGMIAADVHGKNHHKNGSIGAYIDWIDVMTADGQVQRCSPVDRADLFHWTVGGMGLTGVILRAAVRLKAVETGWIRQTLIPAPNLEAAMAALDETSHATYSVAWIDCLSKPPARGRSLIILGEYAAADDLGAHQRAAPYKTPRKRTSAMPFDAPSFLLNSYTVRAFNALYYRNGLRNSGQTIVDWDSFFYPLDSVLGWNRIYGRKGFVQFQCALPAEKAQDGLSALLQEIGKAGQGSFLAVLKRFGPQDSRFSFPMDGHTLALDFPVNRKSLALLDRLDRITLEHDGRFYLAKDSRMSAETLRQSDDRVDSFLKMRTLDNRSQAFVSAQSDRLKI